MRSTDNSNKSKKSQDGSPTLLLGESHSQYMGQRKASIATTANDKKKKRINVQELSPHNLSPKKNLSSSMKP